MIGLLVVVFVGTVGGCAEPGAQGSDAQTSSSAVAQRVRAQQVLDQFVAAGRAGDLAAAKALVSGSDDAFAGRAAIWAANLKSVPWARLTWTAGSARSPLDEKRRNALGGDAWVQQVEVSWALPGESRTADQDLWMTFVDQSTGDRQGVVTLLAGDADGSDADAAAPIWLRQPVRLLHRDDLLLLTDVDDAQEWLTQATAAQAAVAERTSSADKESGRGGTVADPLVVEVPQSRSVFERVLGVSPGSYATVAAAAWPMGSDAGSAPVHVVVNPEASERLSTLGRGVLLVHEAVHVATRSPGSSVPTWMVEGYADQIAYQAHPAGRAPALLTVGEYVREHGAPKGWPTDKDFDAQASDLDLSYDLAWTAARTIADAYGDAQLGRFYAALGDGDTVNGAAERIGTTESALLRMWRRDLRTLARR